MSYEGFEQLLCKNGHYFTQDAYDEKLEKCPVCGEKFVWWNAVDETNGSHDFDENGNWVQIDGFIKLEVLKPAEKCTCEACGNTHRKTTETYKIPKVGGHKC